MSRFKVCPECEGEGTQVHPAFRVITQEDMRRDPDLYDMVRSGTLPEVPCKRCGGQRVVEADPAEDDEWADRLEDARTMARENGDPEAYYNPRLYL